MYSISGGNKVAYLKTVQATRAFLTSFPFTPLIPPIDCGHHIWKPPYLISFEVILGDTIPVHPHDIPIDVDHGVADDVAGAVAIFGAPAKHVKAALEEEAPHADREALPVDHGVPVQNLAGLEDTIHTTERGVPSVAKFCYVFPCECEGLPGQ